MDTTSKAWRAPQPEPLHIFSRVMVLLSRHLHKHSSLRESSSSSKVDDMTCIEYTRRQEALRETGLLPQSRLYRDPVDEYMPDTAPDTHVSQPLRTEPLNLVRAYFALTQEREPLLPESAQPSMQTESALAVPSPPRVFESLLRTSDDGMAFRPAGRASESCKRLIGADGLTRAIAGISDPDSQRLTAIAFLT